MTAVKRKAERLAELRALLERAHSLVGDLRLLAGTVAESDLADDARRCLWELGWVLDDLDKAERR